MKKNNKQLIKKREDLLNKMRFHIDFIKGSLTKITRNKNNINGYHLTSKNANQKTVTKYISIKESASVRKGIKSMKKVREIIEQICVINLDLLKARTDDSK